MIKCDNNHQTKEGTNKTKYTIRLLSKLCDHTNILLTFLAKTSSQSASVLTGLTVTTFLLLFPILQCSAAPLNVPKYKKFAMVCFFGRRSPLVFWDWPKSLLVCCSTFLRDSERFCTAGLFACLHNSRRAPFYNNQKFFPPLYLALINVAAGNVTILIFCKVTSLHHFSYWTILTGKDRNRGPDWCHEWSMQIASFYKRAQQIKIFCNSCNCVLWISIFSQNFFDWIVKLLWFEDRDWYIWCTMIS